IMPVDEYGLCRSAFRIHVIAEKKTCMMNRTGHLRYGGNAATGCRACFSEHFVDGSVFPRSTTAGKNQYGARCRTGCNAPTHKVEQLIGVAYVDVGKLKDG